MTSQIIEGYQLSPQQKRLWTLQKGAGGAAYSARCSVLVLGELDGEALKRAIERVVEKHEILRTAFRCLPGMDVPLQVINGPAVWLTSIDLSMLEPDRCKAEIDALLQATEPTLFAADGRHLFHAQIITVSREEQILLVSLPALCADGVSMKNLVIEIGNSYQAILDGEEIALDATQYADLAAWQNDLLESEETKAGRDYWKKHAAIVADAARLPFEKRESAGQIFEPHCLTLDLGSNMSTRVKSFAEDRCVSTFMLLLACWQVLLWRLDGQSRSTVYAGYDCRKYDELEQALGLLTKYLPITLRLEDGLRFSDVLGQVDGVAA